MKVFAGYLNSRKNVLFCALLCAGVFAVIFFLYGIDMQAVWYPLTICLCFAAGFVLAGYIRMKKRHLELSRTAGYGDADME